MKEIKKSDLQKMLDTLIIEDVAKKLEVSKTTIYNLIKKYGLKTVGRKGRSGKYKKNAKIKIIL